MFVFTRAVAVKYSEYSGSNKIEVHVLLMKLVLGRRAV